jgi:transcription antitermination factor NusG
MDHWFVLHVRIRSELLVRSVLEQKGFECFTPTFQQSRVYTDRVKNVQTALFPGYVFCHFAPHDSRQILVTPAVKTILGDGRDPIPLPEQEIGNLRCASSSETARPEKYPGIGQRVRVQQGLFTGVEGLLISRKGRDRLVVSVDLIRSSFSIELDSWQLEPAGFPNMLSRFPLRETASSR